jgi:hypothetical protein
MTALIALLTVVLLFAVISLITAPLRGRRADQAADPQREDLEEARAAKYREIRDAEFDYRTGKLSREDYEAVDGSLRTEAVDILDRLDPPADSEPVSEPRPEGETQPKADPDPQQQV